MTTTKINTKINKHIIIPFECRINAEKKHHRHIDFIIHTILNFG